MILEKPSVAIKNANWYHNGVFESDATIAGMLVMLDEMYFHFKDEDTDIFFKKLYSEESPIKFWWLEIENFGFADDLFIKMNARGKRLTRFEMFKSEFESALEESDLSDDWKEKIDNEWLEFFWQYFGGSAPKKAEHGLFRFIVFIANTLYSQQIKDKCQLLTSDVELAQYAPVITCLRTNSNFRYICKALNLLPNFCLFLDLASVNSSYSVYISNLFNGKNMEYWEYAKLYALIDYFVQNNADTSGFGEFERVLNNLVAAQREINKRDSIFNSQIDAIWYGNFTKGIDILIEQIIANSGDVIFALSKTENIVGLIGYKQESLKANYILNKIALKKDIIALENHNYICGQTLNIVFENKMWLSLQQLEQVLEYKQIFMRLIQSYSKESMLIRVGYLWPIVFGDLSEYSFRKHRFRFRESKNGDLLLAAGPGDTLNWQVPLRKTIKAISILPFKDIKAEMETLLAKNIATLTFDSYVDYFVKYTEFYANEESSCCLLPEDGNLSEYELMICKNDKDWEISGNPFCIALAREIGLKFKPFGGINNKIEICKDVIFKICSDGYWQVEINNEQIKKSVSAHLGGDDGDILLRKKGEDCIENAVMLGKLILSQNSLI